MENEGVVEGGGGEFLGEMRRGELGVSMAKVAKVAIEASRFTV